MSEHDVGAILESLNGVKSQMSALETTVKVLLERTEAHERLLRILKNVGILILGVGLGTGLVQINQLVGFIGG